MSWKQTRAAYLERDGNLQGANTEELLARRVLAGMGFKHTQVYAMEHALCGREYPDDSMWARVERLFTTALVRQGGDARMLVRGWTIIAQETDTQHKTVLERFDILKDMQSFPEQFPLVLARVKDTTVGLAFVYWQASALSGLKPPYKVIDSLRLGNYEGRLIVQEIPVFVGSLANYSELIRLEE